MFVWIALKFCATIAMGGDCHDEVCMGTMVHGTHWNNKTLSFLGDVPLSQALSLKPEQLLNEYEIGYGVVYVVINSTAFSLRRCGQRLSNDSNFKFIIQRESQHSFFDWFHCLKVSIITQWIAISSRHDAFLWWTLQVKMDVKLTLSSTPLVQHFITTY